MQRSFRTLLLGLVLASSLACRAVLPGNPPVTPTSTPFSALPPPASTQAVVPSEPVATASLPTERDESGSVEPMAGSLPVDSFQVRLHPDGPLYVGDQVSIEVIALDALDRDEAKVQIQVDGPQGSSFSPVDFGVYGIGDRTQATLEWVWNTESFSPGEHVLTFSILPDGPSWVETVTLNPAEQVPPPEPQAEWAQAESDCCLVYYITGTEAERDLDSLLELLDEQAQAATEKLGQPTRKEAIPVTFLPRLLGQGGFTGQEIAVSYLDEHYAPGDIATVLHHELVHWLDNRLGGDLRPVFLAEGLAVYLTGGHFKSEDLLPRAAALLPGQTGCVAADRLLSLVPQGWTPTGGFPKAGPCGLNRYLPLPGLIDNFYQAQHETGYLQAGALVSWMVETWGWEAFSDFYRDIHAQPSKRQSDAIDAALQEHFHLTLAELEQQFLDALAQQPLESRSVEDLRLTIETFDAVRRYQAALDPSAYYLTAWLPDPWKMRQRGVVADYLRHPIRPENQALETLLIAAGQALEDENYDQAERYLAAANVALAVFKANPLPTR